MEKTTIKYTVEKSHYNNDYIVWRESSTKRGICSKNKFRGKFGDCLKERKRLMKEEGLIK